jgi:hypothetical protein
MLVQARVRQCRLSECSEGLAFSNPFGDPSVVIFLRWIAQSIPILADEVLSVADVLLSASTPMLVGVAASRAWPRRKP